MAELRALPTEAKEIEESVVKLLEVLLEGARKGEITALMAVHFGPTGDHYVISQGVDMLRKIGSLELLKYEITSGALEGGT